MGTGLGFPAEGLVKRNKSSIKNGVNSCQYIDISLGITIHLNLFSEMAGNNLNTRLQKIFTSKVS